MPLARSAVAVFLVSAIMIAAAWWDLQVALGPSRRIQVIVLRAAIWLGVALSGAALAPLIVQGAVVGRVVLLTYQVALLALAVGLLVALLLSSWERTGVSDLVVELAVGRASSVAASLARALGDPTLQVGYWVPERGGYVDAAGQQIILPGLESGRAVTPVEWEGTRIAVLIHDPAIGAATGLRRVSLNGGRSSSRQRPLASTSTRSARPASRHPGVGWLGLPPTNADGSSAGCALGPAAG